MEFLDIFYSFIASITPQEWTIGGIASFLALAAIRGIFMFAFMVELPKAIVRFNFPKALEKVLLSLYGIAEKITVIYDAATNVTLGTVLFMDLPGGWHTFSYRVGKYTHEDKGWRGKVATKVCVILDRIDPDHCSRIYLTGF